MLVSVYNDTGDWPEGAPHHEVVGYYSTQEIAESYMSLECEIDNSYIMIREVITKPRKVTFEEALVKVKDKHHTAIEQLGKL